MARRAFFSFHYKNDVWRANQVRNSWVTKDDKEAAGFVDAAEFEKVEKEGEDAIKRWINKQLEGTSVTVVLIGSETSNRPYVKYELQKSYEKGNGMLGIYIHKCKDKDGNTCTKGSNQFGEIGKDAKGNPVYFSVDYPCYDWVDDDGYNNMGKWIEAAAKKAGR
ncbi:MAG TPA: TIR domain-containing protein [Flavobacterium sp.]|nr:TIR domain-containing protein [Flavobacterium sp.]HRZ75251.1 TIR domain-containing protein [Flavobacterium sp.]